jgi:hypothetical protein
VSARVFEAAGVRPGLKVVDGIQDSTPEFAIAWAPAIQAMLLERSRRQAQERRGFLIGEVRRDGLGQRNLIHCCVSSRPASIVGMHVSKYSADDRLDVAKCRVEGAFVETAICAKTVVTYLRFYADTETQKRRNCRKLQIRERIGWSTRS